MRKFLVAVLMLSLAVPAFADVNGAKVLPAGILRTTVVPAYVFAVDNFKSDFGFDTSSADDVAFFNTGIALEYGVNDWITAAVQWAPGWTIWSDVDLAFDEDAELHRFFDMFAGAKVQIIGENAPVRRGDMRFAFAPGLKFPLGYPDWDGQYDSDDFEDNINNPFVQGALAGGDITANEAVGASLAGSGELNTESTVEDPFVASSPDTNQLGLGLRLYYDYIFTENWWVNFFGEGAFYLLNGRAPSVAAHAIAELEGVEDEFDRGWDIELEIEPHFETMLGPGLQLGASLPVKLDYAPEIKLDGDKLSKWESDALNGEAPFEDDESTTGPFSTLSVGPTLRLFARGWTLPTEFVLKYNAPIAGRNASTTHSFSLQIRNYLSF